MRKAVFLSALILLFTAFAFAQEASFIKDSPISNKGVWVTTFSTKEVLYSKRAVKELIETCKKYNLNEIYIQIYRAGRAYYDSKILGRSQYDKIIQSAGIDTIDFLIEEALKENIKVFAWINVLSLAQNTDAGIIKKLGESILTRDQYMRTSLKGDNENETDKYYLRENQLFLEPGDPLVYDYILSIINEIGGRYSRLSGIQLDYIRYPYPVPYTPSSKFGNYGLNYGYGEKNIARFKEKTGLDALSLNNPDEYLAWDNWKRIQVTSLVKIISEHIKKNFPSMLLSCAVISSPERAYTTLFQDWPLWLEQGIIDSAALMNYTKDDQLAKEILTSALCLRGNGKVYNGVGLFLTKENPIASFRQIELVNNLNPDGIILFSYDDLS